MRTIILTGGGTAGHVLPHIALLPTLKKQFNQIFYLGGDGIEKQIAAEHNIAYRQITTVKLRRKLTLSNLLIPFKLIKGIREAKKLLQEIKPDVIFSKGGFVALPVVLAAAQLKIKVIAHESDMSLGLANRLSARHCNTICTTFPIQNAKYHNLVHTGAIIRPSIYQGDPNKIKLPNNGKPNLLVTGGSLGAAAINQAVWHALDMLTERFNVLHIAGKGKTNPNLHKDNYLQVEYLPSPENAFAWADVVVSRAGSGTVSELLALKKPALYIPLPKDESRGDQIQNAEYLQNLGVCHTLEQSALNPECLTEAVVDVYRHRQDMIAQCEKQTWIDGTEKVLSYLQ